MTSGRWPHSSHRRVASVLLAVATVLIASLAALFLASGRAHADTLLDAGVGNARFASAGVRIFDVDSVGSVCLIGGFCSHDNVASLSKSAVTRQRSSDAGQPVFTVCRLNDLVKVRVIGGELPLFDRVMGSDKLPTLTGWVAATGLKDTPTLHTCGVLD